MKTKSIALLLALAFLSILSVSTHAQGTAFTYQGRLNDGLNPANGIYDLRFEIYDASSGGATAGGALTNSATSVSNGLFTVTLDFGAGVFDGSPRWLEIGVHNSGPGAFVVLVPRQPITAAPYAIKAGTVTGPIDGALITAGTITGAQITSNSITAGQLASGAVGLPELVKPYQSGRIASSALPLSFGDYLLITNFPTAFNTTPTLAFSVAQVGTIVGAPPQVFPLTATPTNFSARIAQPSGAPLNVKTVSSPTGFTFLSAAKVLGRPAVAYASLSCDLVEEMTCTTNFSSFNFAACQVGGGSSNGCYQESLEIECTGTGNFYSTNCSGGLRFGTPQNNAGNIWINSTITTNTAAQFPSLALTALPFQVPMVAYFASNSTSLYFARATSLDGSTWPTPTQVVNHADVGRYCSLGLVNGNPAISYYNFTAGDLEYIRATNASGVFNPAARAVVSSAFTVGKYSSLAIIQGQPAIACHYNESAGVNTIAFFRSSNVDGTSWGVRRDAAPVGVASGTSRLVALAEVNGLPAIAYYDPTSSQVKFVRASDVNGTSWLAPAVSFPATGGDCDLEVINGRPTILFHNGSQLRVAAALDADGTAWSLPVTPSLGTLSPTLGGMIANGSVPGVFYVAVGTSATLRYASPFAQQFILNWIAVEP